MDQHQKAARLKKAKKKNNTTKVTTYRTTETYTLRPGCLSVIFSMFDVPASLGRNILFRPGVASCCITL